MTAIHSQTSQKSCVALVAGAFESSTSSGQLPNSSIMNRSATTTRTRPPLSSNNTTPTSTRSSSLSSLSHPDLSSASSDASAGDLKRLSTKSNLKSSRSVGADLNRRSAPPTVRFLDPEPMPRRSTEPVPAILKSQTPERLVRPGYSRGMSTPDLGPHQYREKKIVIPTLTRPPLLSQASKRSSAASSPGGTASSPRTLSSAQSPRGRFQHSSGSVNQLRQRVDKRFSAPVVPSQIDPRLDPRWSGIPLPAGFVPPSRTPTPTQRVTSYHSIASNLSSSPAPSVNTAPPSGKYDPLQNYIPCMAAMCTAHYTPVHSGPTYYAAQEPYRLSKHHGYCPRHASKEMQEANALCKREYETMRQNAGRKTLGAVAQDFEIFLQLYREARQTEDARLQEAQSQAVLGLSPTATIKQKAPQNNASDWRYTPRNCTKKRCASMPYSPYSTQHFSFYNSANPSTQLLPLTTLCPSCSKAESEGFGAKLMEKWSSRCGWDGEEWDGWYQTALHHRKGEQEFWEKAQERVVRERRAKKATSEAAEKAEEKQESTEEQSVAGATPTKEKRKSIFKRMFRRSETTGAVAVAVAAA
ncbi:hypothetical protein C7974DRAFT_138358 [Boeremia exigua]|uniref:uncharacterized protein n=1 Tax=Boeremia exigua TaxID=749465 RepID=UPI001E8DC257|nr:uncharacterized protein C7974DRAFT_138358 [Boeremia exigua]KAH6639762.1 hypothetical protein C7974DRAFT_138358 [Boeremia exigua]